MSEEIRPYLSIVTWGRNDGYIENYIERANRALQCLIRQLEEAALDCEIIVCEWNPTPGRPLLLDSLELSKSSAHVALRGVLVDPRHHRRFKGAVEQGVHNGEAWNVGIRRARGRFILPKASDTYFSSATIERIARRDLDTDAMYRVDRHDVAVPPSFWFLPDDELLMALDTLPSELNAYIAQLPHWRLRDLHTNAAGDFLLMSMEWWHRLRGHPADITTLSLDGDSLVMHAAAALGVRQCCWPSPCKVYKPRHDHQNNDRIVFVWQQWQRWLEAALVRIGGVALAHRARMLLDYPRRRLRNISILAPSVERQFAQPAARWARGTRPDLGQPVDWGLAGETLQETTLCHARWEGESTHDHE